MNGGHGGRPYSCLQGRVIHPSLKFARSSAVLRPTSWMLTELRLKRELNVRLPPATGAGDSIFSAKILLARLKRSTVTSDPGAESTSGCPRLIELTAAL